MRIRKSPSAGVDPTSEMSPSMPCPHRCVSTESSTRIKSSAYILPLLALQLEPAQPFQPEMVHQTRPAELAPIERVPLDAHRPADVRALACTRARATLEPVDVERNIVLAVDERLRGKRPAVVLRIGVRGEAVRVFAGVSDLWSSKGCGNESPYRHRK